LKDLSNILNPAVTGDDAARRVALLMAECSWSERGDRVRQIMRVTGWSRNKVYDLAKRGGWSSGRATRSDKGDTVLTDEQKAQLARLTLKTRRKGKGMIAPAEVVLDVARQNNLIDEDVDITAATLNRYLREMRLSKREMKRASDNPPHARVKTDFPNQRWQFDITVCVQFYLDASTGLQFRDALKELYHNKPAVLKDIVKKKKLLRFVMIDHFSGAFYVRYYLAAGEHSFDALDFLIQSMSPKFDPDRLPMRGVPVELLADKGSALNSHLCLNFLDALGVKVLIHKPGNPRAKGAVEGFMWHWEQWFESRLAFEKIHDLDELNVLSQEYCARICASKIHSRHRATRSAKWSTVRSDQLINLPEADVCREIAHTKPVERTVKNDRTVWLANDPFLVADADLIGKRVVARRNPYNLDEITIDVDGGRLVCPKIERDDEGWQVNSLRAVSGDLPQPEHSHCANNSTMKQMNDLPDVPANLVGFKRGVDDVQGAFLGGRKTGEDIEFDPAQPRLFDNTSARIRLLELLDVEQFTAGEVAWLDIHWQDEVDEDRIRETVEIFKTKNHEDTTHVKLIR